MTYITEDRSGEEVLFEKPGYRIRLARNRRAVGNLLERMYRWRGYKAEGLAVPSPGTFNQITLEAVSGDETVGTITIGLDSPLGLQGENLYKAEIAQYRQRGARVCEYSKLAVSPDCSCKKVLAPLFHLAHIYAHLIHRATDLFVEVNPRHAVFYRRLLGFSQVGAEKTCPRVNAPAVLLHLDLNYAAEQVSIYGGGRKTCGRSLYPEVFSPQEQEALRRKIETMERTPSFSVPPSRASVHSRNQAEQNGGYVPMPLIPARGGEFVGLNA